MNKLNRVKDFWMIREEIEDFLDQIFLFAEDGCPEDSPALDAILDVENKIKSDLESIEIIVGDLYGGSIENQ